jgi:hypothetical protein
MTNVTKKQIKEAVHVDRRGFNRYIYRAEVCGLKFYTRDYDEVRAVKKGEWEEFIGSATNKAEFVDKIFNYLKNEEQ